MKEQFSIDIAADQEHEGMADDLLPANDDLFDENESLDDLDWLEIVGEVKDF